MPKKQNPWLMALVSKHRQTTYRNLPRLQRKVALYANQRHNLLQQHQLPNPNQNSSLRSCSQRRLHLAKQLLLRTRWLTLFRLTSLPRQMHLLLQCRESARPILTKLRRSETNLRMSCDDCTKTLMRSRIITQGLSISPLSMRPRSILARIGR